MLAQLINGIVAGSGYALIAVGLSYTVGLARVFNFAYGTAYVFAAYIAITISANLPGGYAAAIPLTLIAMCIGGGIFALVIVFPAIRRSELAVMVATLGVDIALTSLGQRLFGTQVQSLSSPLLQIKFQIFGVRMNAQELVSIGAALLVTFLLTWFISHTRAGTQLRGAAENRELAAVSGINITRSYVIAVVVGIVVASISALTYSPLTQVTASTGDNILLIAFAVIAMAGVGRLWGAVVIAFGIGIFESLFIAYVNPTYPDVAVYCALIILLLVRPRGLFSGHV